MYVYIICLISYHLHFFLFQFTFYPRLVANHSHLSFFSSLLFSLSLFSLSLSHTHILFSFFFSLFLSFSLSFSFTPLFFFPFSYSLSLSLSFLFSLSLSLLFPSFFSLTFYSIIQFYSILFSFLSLSLSLSLCVCVCASVIQLFYTMLLLAPARFAYQNFWVHTAYLMAVFLSSAWGGATFYFEVFSENYTKRLAENFNKEKKKQMEEKEKEEEEKEKEKEEKDKKDKKEREKKRVLPTNWNSVTSFSLFFFGACATLYVLLELAIKFAQSYWTFDWLIDCGALFLEKLELGDLFQFVLLWLIDCGLFFSSFQFIF